MLKKLIVGSAALALVGAAVAGPASAHHSYAMYDLKTTLTLSGTVEKWGWTNPHAFLDILIDGKHYELEAASPSILSRTGMNRNTLKPGDKVSLKMNPRRDKTPAGYLVSVDLPDGKTLHLDAARQQQP
jgi:hypothetical protein